MRTSPGATLDSARHWISRLALAAAVLTGVFLVYAIATGFPPELLGRVIHFKNAKTPFGFMLFCVLLWLGAPPDGRERLKRARDGFSAWTAGSGGIVCLVLVYGALFFWQQAAEYLAVKINFLPFSFFDYMPFFLFETGKINYTGYLHSYYHLNNILILLAPVWYVFKSPWVLITIYGWIAAAAALPLFGIAKRRFDDPAAAWVMAFVYLNYRYLQNVLEMNFCVEIFYALFLFSALYFAMRAKWFPYYLAVFLGLLVKEDSFLYFGALGVLVFFLGRTKGAERGVAPAAYRLHGVATVLLSLLYVAFLIKVFIPLTGNTILKGDIENFEGHGSSIGGILLGFLTKPHAVLTALFGSAEKWETYFKLTYRLAFLPLLTPAALLTFVPIFPLFLHNTGRDTDFIHLHYHYAAAVVPFVMLSLVFGFSNLTARLKGAWRSRILWGLCLLLVFLNGGHFRTQKITKENLKSIAWARSVPQGTNLVTHGHLLPYIGYRRYNYYFANAWEYVRDPDYLNADYYLIDFQVKLYPADKAYIRKKVREYMARPDYRLIRRDGDKRYLFKRE